MSTISANTFLAADGTTTTEPNIPALDQRMAKAWVSFNGIGTLSIIQSYNVSSLTDNSVGDYTVNWSSSLPVGYCTTSDSIYDTTMNNGNTIAANRGKTQLQYRLRNYANNSATTYDIDECCVIAFSQ
jgi:hypothetical protein